MTRTSKPKETALATYNVFPAHTSRITLVVWERGLWGREEVHIEERRGHWGKAPATWVIAHGGAVWSKRHKEFIYPHGENQWKSCRYTSAEACMVEAQRAATMLMARDRKFVDKYDAERALLAVRPVLRKTPTLMTSTTQSTKKG